MATFASAGVSDRGRPTDHHDPGRSDPVRRGDVHTGSRPAPDRGGCHRCRARSRPRAARRCCDRAGQRRAPAGHRRGPDRPAPVRDPGGRPLPHGSPGDCTGTAWPTSPTGWAVRPLRSVRERSCADPTSGPSGCWPSGSPIALQVLSIAQLPAGAPAVAAWVLAVTLGRLAVAVACGPWVQAARDDGLGAMVIGSVTPARLVIAGALAAAVAVIAALGRPARPGPRPCCGGRWRPSGSRSALAGWPAAGSAAAPATSWARPRSWRHWPCCSSSPCSDLHGSRRTRRVGCNGAPSAGNMGM